jgi:hypothetical protein
LNQVEGFKEFPKLEKEDFYVLRLKRKGKEMKIENNIKEIK